MTPHYPSLYLRPNSERTVRNGHPWVFSGAVERPPRDADTGDIVDVFDAHERFVCRGFYNRRSLIRVRSLTQDPNRSHQLRPSSPNASPKPLPSAAAPA